MARLDSNNSPFKEIFEKDPRYSARAYLHLMEALSKHYTSDQSTSAETIMDDFRSVLADDFGPFASFVLNEFGIMSSEDVGEMVSNLIEARFVPPPADGNDLSFLNC